MQSTVARQITKVQVSKLKKNPLWARGAIDEAVKVALAGSLKSIGQIIPIITHGDVILDGHCRWLAALLAGGISELDAIVLDYKPTNAELLRLQSEIEFHRTPLTVLQRSNVLANLQKENGWTVSQLAAEMHLAQPIVSKLLKYQTACPELKALLESSKIDGDKAYLLCHLESHDEQRKLLVEAGNLSREQLRQRIRATRTNAPEVSVACFALKHASVMLRSSGMTLGSSIEAFLEVVKELKKGQREGLSLKTVCAEMADRAKAAQ